MFPQRRFAQAGATEQEIERIEREFDAASPAAQQGLEGYWSSIADGDLTAWVEQWREHYEQLPGDEGGESGHDAPGVSPAPSAPQQGGPGNGKSPAVDDAPAADPVAVVQVVLEVNGDGSAEKTAVGVSSFGLTEVELDPPIPGATVEHVPDPDNAENTIFEVTGVPGPKPGVPVPPGTTVTLNLSYPAE